LKRVGAGIGVSMNPSNSFLPAMSREQCRQFAQPARNPVTCVLDLSQPSPRLLDIGKGTVIIDPSNSSSRNSLRQTSMCIAEGLSWMLELDFSSN
jgi:hypothetical protein